MAHYRPVEMDGSNAFLETPVKLESAAKPRVSVVIPVKNAVGIIGRVLAAVMSQRTPWLFEALVIDSGSTDGTLDLVRSFPGVRLIEIRPSEYGHGRTRNLGVSETVGEFVAFLTHDAIPADDMWLARLVQPMLRDELVMGVFGRHIAHEGATACTVRDLASHFEGFHTATGVFYCEDPQRYREDVGYRQYLHYYSDNNSCLRRSFWAVVPYPDVDFAEDQLWAKELIERGYKKAYAHEAVVFHSHDYGPVETLKRSFDEASAFKRYFGYVLAPSLRLAFGHARGCALRDVRYLRSLGQGFGECLLAFLLAYAKQLGYYLGSRSERIPESLQPFISIDKRLKAGKTSMKGILGSTFRTIRREGLIGALRLIRPRPYPAGSQTLLAPAEMKAPPPIKTDVVGFYAFALESSRFTFDTSAEELDCLWFIPDFGPGSGGHLNIFRCIANLESHGMKCGIVLVGPHGRRSARETKLAIDDGFCALQAEVMIGTESLPRTKAVVATSWITAYFVRNFETPAKKLYFVQDYEPLFYPAGAEHALALATYSFGFHAVCSGSWLAGILRRTSRSPVSEIGFSYEKDRYVQVPKRDVQKRVFFYVRPPTARRGFELGMLALHLVGERRPDVHFIFAGWDISHVSFKHVHLNCGTVPLDELPDLYSQCDVALVLSFSNMSLLPYELMACGTAVVTNNDECATWGLNPDVASFADPTPEAMAEAIIRLLDDDDLRAEQSRRAKDFVMKTSWEREAERVHEVISSSGVEIS